MNMNQWPAANSFSEVASPGLILNVDLVRGNLSRMMEQVNGDQSRIRPHVKTHKMSRLIEMQLEVGIDQYKVATLAEAAMVAGAGAKDILIAYPMVGPNLRLLVKLIKDYPEVTFSCLVDHRDGLQLIEERHSDLSGSSFGVWIDVDCGMHRTGIPFGPEFEELQEASIASESIQYRGLHVYDGHLHQPDLSDRHGGATIIKEQILTSLAAYPDQEVVVGGSPNFGFWSEQSSWQCSPGTPLFWDEGYGSNYPDLEYSPAIALLSRVISKPGVDRICIDLGYKAVAAEMPLERRVVFPSLPDVEVLGQSEEHLVLKTSLANRMQLGQEIIAFPRHVCPTVALHSSVQVVAGGRVLDDRWEVDARARLQVSPQDSQE